MLYNYIVSTVSQSLKIYAQLQVSQWVISKYLVAFRCVCCSQLIWESKLCTCSENSHGVGSEQQCFFYISSKL